MTTQWPPKVWHGVLDPQTGDPIPPVMLGDSPRLRREERRELEQWIDEMTKDSDTTK